METPFFLERLKLAKKVHEDIAEGFTNVVNDDLAVLSIAVVFAALVVRDAIREARAAPGSG